MKKSLLILIAVFILLVVVSILSSPANAATTFNGVVEKVHDGDTVMVRNETGGHEVFRLYRIDAPELTDKQKRWGYQPYASEARTALLNLCLGKIATVKRLQTDQYGRSLGNVNCQGQDVASYMIENGNAWAYRFTSTVALRKKQATAKSNGVGLWASSAVEPYLWRKGVTE